MNGSAPTGSGSDALAVGWYGKVPASGDFVARRLPHAFLEPWDAWLQSVLAGSRRRLGEGWRDAFLSMPAWRFVIEPGVAGDDAWAGLLLPSVDAVGRYFPLTAACALPARDLQPAQTLWRARKWYDELEALVLGLLAPDGDRDALDGQLARRRFDVALVALRTAAVVRPTHGRPSLWIPLSAGDTQHDDPEPIREAAPLSCAGPDTAWLAEASEIFGPSLLLSERLPSAEQFCALMNGKWADHGWRTNASPTAGPGAEAPSTPAARESV